MKPTQTQLLASLGSGVRPYETPAGQIPAPGGEGFSALLQGALAGSPRSGLAVRFAPSVSGMFGPDAQRLISEGVDAAAVSGVGHALILHDEHTLRVDVRNRVVLEAREIDPGEVITNIDGFVSVRGPAQDPGEGEEKESTPAGEPVDAPARVVRNASLVHALAGRAAPVSTS